ncbi:MAG: Fe-S cluster assembly protein SufD [Xanthomonadales bacterium]|nr:Fe-S cluster assembly protein SufD [Xanthomonadales bacterium]
MGAFLDSMLAGRDGLGGVRAEAAAALLRDGLPGPREEAWKYTSLRALEQRRYAPAPGEATDVPALAAFALPGVDGARLVFVNGVFQPALSDLQAAPGVEILPYREHPGQLDKDLEGHHGTGSADAFLRLNTALVEDGASIRVVAGADAGAPIHLVILGAPAAADLAWQLRLQVELGAGARLSLVEHHLGNDEHAHLGNLVANYVLGAGARLELLQVQDAGERATLIRRGSFHVGEDAQLAATTLEAGAQMTRHDFRVHLAGRGARLESRGVFVLHGRQHADTHMDVRHEARDTSSDVLWRGVADQRSRGVFHGAITIAEGADGADAALSNKNLLLSPQAEIDTQPALEIYADEVKAAHGATVGQLDEQALFYLRTRGIPLDAARRILVSAFCSAVFADLQPAVLRERLDELLATRLPQAGE